MKQDPNKRGALTVEAAVILPFYILTIVFILNFMNIFYTQLAVQMGMNNAARVVAQYSYLVDRTVGIEKLELKKETDAKAKEVANQVSDVKKKLNNLSGFFAGGIQLNELGDMIGQGKELGTSLKNLGTSLKGVKSEELVNALIATGTETGGSVALTHLLNSYLDEMKINRSLIDGDIQVIASLDASHDHDLVLTARYQYKDPMFSVFFDTIPMKQSVVVRPWVGGPTEGLNKGLFKK